MPELTRRLHSRFEYEGTGIRLAVAKLYKNQGLFMQTSRAEPHCHLFTLVQ